MLHYVAWHCMTLRYITSHPIHLIHLIPFLHTLDPSCSHTDNFNTVRLTTHSLTEKGEPTPLSEYKGKVLLIVNTASKCGFTPQYEGLEKLYKDMKEKHGDDFVILGFPCNQFGGQDPGSDEEIQSFCQINYGVSFPIVRSACFFFPLSYALYSAHAIYWN